MTRAKANRRLRKAFDSFNKLYFAGQLKRPEVLEYGKLMPKAIGEQSFEQYGVPSIVIDETLMNWERTTAITLLHEMVHLKNGPDYKPEHGMLFDAEIHRLYMAGAYDGLL